MRESAPDNSVSGLKRIDASLTYLMCLTSLTRQIREHIYLYTYFEIRVGGFLGCACQDSVLVVIVVARPCTLSASSCAAYAVRTSAYRCVHCHWRLPKRGGASVVASLKSLRGGENNISSNDWRCVFETARYVISATEATIDLSFPSGDL